MENVSIVYSFASVFITGSNNEQFMKSEYATLKQGK